MASSSRRRFLATLAAAGPGAAALASLPPWARAVLAAADPGIFVRNDWPEHWETSLAALGGSWVTPTDVFFVRSHFVPPDVDAASWRLEIAGLVETPLAFALADLRGMPAVDAPITLECAGNGRGLFRLPSTSGTQWERGAVGTARWRGVPLRALLERAGVRPEARHVWFEAADQATLPQAPRFVRSIPLEKAMDDVLLAYGMNGAPLGKRHGAPLRAIVPGWFGMASTKWLTRIRVEATPSDNHFMVRGYRYTYPGEDPTAAAPVEALRVKSLITRPLEGSVVRPGPVAMRGFAWAGAAGVKRVEISSDGGASWREATLTGETSPGAWRAWEAQVDAARSGDLVLLARATDGAGETQPMAARANAGGYGNNSIHQVSVHVRA
ncbi:MAG TPA: sulfite oxidase [Candidatus Eisenbacteria bacterium]|jgi:DMSO/TMAO reductase YedYZ molybdopterin-dependent catalytic subunit